MTNLCDLLGKFLTTAGITAAVAFLISFILEKIPGWHERVPAELKQAIYAALCFPIGFGAWFLAPKFGCDVPPVNDVILAVLLAAWAFLSGSMFHLATKRK